MALESQENAQRSISTAAGKTENLTSRQGAKAVSTKATGNNYVTLACAVGLTTGR